MGLPMWRAPSPDAKATKADATAPGRSPIRRRLPPVAGRHAARVPRAPRAPRSPRSPRLLDNDFLAYVSRFDSPEPEPAPRPSASASAALRVPPPPVPESRNYARLGSVQATGREWLAFARAQSSREQRPTAAAPAFGEVARNPRPRPPPALVARPPSSSFPADPPRRRSSVNWGWAPLDDPAVDHNAVGLPPLRRMGRRTIADGPLPSSSLRESWSPATEGTLDGLGDRERSMSPVDDHWNTMLSTVAPDPLAPSANSSFASAAASASFSNSHTSSRAGSANSNSASSTRTHLTVPSRRHTPQSELLARACESSDSDTASDTDEEDAGFGSPHSPSSFRRQHAHMNAQMQQMIHEQHQRLQRLQQGEAVLGTGRAQSNSQRIQGELSRLNRNDLSPERSFSHQLDGPAEAPSDPEEDLDVLRTIGGRNLLPRSSRNRRFDLAPAARSFDDELQTLDQELRDARAILERLVGRDDVSDEFWASVGLAPSVERLDERDLL